MLSIEITGPQLIQARLARLIGALNTTVILDEAAAVLLARTRQRFLSQTAPDGSRWRPSFASLLRAATSRGGGTLYDTGRLFHSIQLYSTSEPDTRLIGSDVPYGVDHQLGRNGMPQRMFLGVNDEDASVIETVLFNRINRILNS